MLSTALVVLFLFSVVEENKHEILLTWARQIDHNQGAIFASGRVREDSEACLPRAEALALYQNLIQQYTMNVNSIQSASRSQLEVFANYLSVAYTSEFKDEALRKRCLAAMWRQPTLVIQFNVCAWSETAQSATSCQRNKRKAFEVSLDPYILNRILTSEQAFQPITALTTMAL
ncbi:hypothetical protein PROFUN_11996 [Planoprotostelium fungivorum]|uniref:Uncharacterized protein n=1 Tax=Planoprotostelium fungivorum TaxID=1890364 RepID=A0A2P6MRB4_9EUKA|nr:hypothetical protein PROFUN_11996 [Planoprotostelium fungivorum]